MLELPIEDLPEESDPQIDLLDSEVVASAELLADLVTKYSHRPSSYSNLKSFASEAIDRFEEIGLQVLVDWIGPSLRTPPGPPEISIVRRITPFDHDEMAYEVKKGIADKFYPQTKKKR